MRQALKNRRGPRRAEVPVRSAQSESWPAPTEGWDTETPLAELPPTRAIVLDNYVPHGIQLEMRRGYNDHATGIDDTVETLMAYNSGSGSKLFAAAGGDVFDVSIAGAVGAASLSSMHSAFWSAVNFETAGGQFLWACNDSASDAPHYYNGTIWQIPALTISGLSQNDICYVAESKQRLFVVFADTMTAGYLDVESIAGTVHLYPLGSVFSRGGRLVAIARITRDGGDGLEDLTAFLTSEGEVAVYQGSNPADADDWAKVGTWNVGAPIGARPFVDLGGDLGVLTRNGLVSLLAVMAGAGDVDPNTFPYINARIATPVRDRARVDPANTVWSGVVFPAADLLIINAPLSTDAAQQFVRNRITGGWGRFTEWNFACFALFNGDLYAGGIAGGVFKCWDGYADGDEDIVGRLQWPWSAMGSRGVVKQVVKARPIVTTSTGASVALVARADYAATPAMPAPSAQPLSDALIWGVGLWGIDRWGGRSLGARQWRTVSAVGHAISIALEARSRQSHFALNGLDIIFNIGGPV